jgi:hypothetical protein
LERGSDDRLNGWATVRAWLSVREFNAADGVTFRSPALLIHPSCDRFLRTITTLVADAKDSEDVEPTPDEFPAAAIRRLVMQRPMPAKGAPPALPPGAIGHEIEQLRRENAAKRYTSG